MPKLTKEVSSGAQFSRSSQEGVVADSQTRVFKILLDQPGEVVNLQSECGIFIGDQHPYNTNIYCQSFSAAFDGDSRMVLVCTFQYGSRAGSDGGGQNDPQSQSPDIRPANWSTSTVLTEVPARQWYVVDEDGEIGASKVSAANPVGDMYDGVTYSVAMMNISIEQYEPSDPTKHIELVGSVNSTVMEIGSLTCGKRTIMFRGVSFQPVVESWGQLVYRGWKASYEFLYRQDSWDMRVPVTGFSVKAFAPGGATASQDAYGQPLKHSGGKIQNPLALPDNVTAGEKVRAMIKVFEYENGGASQCPSAQPVPLNDDGTPRKGDPLIKRYCPYEPIDFRSRLQLRLT